MSLKRISDLTVEEVRDAFSYDFINGGLIWRNGSRYRSGQRAGTLSKDGYVSVEYNGVRYVVHRLVWLYHHGRWPTCDIRHIDGNKQRNFIENLREVTKADIYREMVASIGASHLGRKPKPVKMFSCMSCGKETVRKRGGYKHMFCSNECCTSYNTAQSYRKWIETGASFRMNPRALKRLLEIRDGYSCTRCGISEWMGERIVLELEHKNGNGDDNSPDNICLMCPNCHSLTPTYKGKNRGNGRFVRIQRYHAGLSY